MRDILNGLWFLGTGWLYGIFIGVFFQFLKFFGLVRVLHGERFPFWRNKVILASNHPSLLEPFLLPALFFPKYLFYPFTTPWSTPDRKNFYQRWLFRLLFEARSIAVDRTPKSSRLRRVISRMKRILEAGGNIIIFPEAGRTFKGENFLFSETGKKIRELKKGIGWLVDQTNALVVPVWVEGTDKVLPNRSDRLFSFPRLGKITIKIGEILKFNDSGNKKEITAKIAQALLKLADEEE